METPVDRIRSKINALSLTLEAHSYALLPTSRGLEAIIDKQFELHARNHRWYAVVSPGDHIYAVADIECRRISLQRYILVLADPTRTFDEMKHVSFINKVGLDCRVANLEDRVGRQAVMRNRLPKRDTTSQYKGVSKAVSTNLQVKWKAAIKGDGGSIYLGYFDDEKWAAMVYDAAAYLLFEGSAHFNLPDLCPNLDALDVAAAIIARHRHKKLRSS